MRKVKDFIFRHFIGLMSFSLHYDQIDIIVTLSEFDCLIQVYKYGELDHSTHLNRDY